MQKLEVFQFSAASGMGRDFQGLVKKGMRMWRDRNDADATLVFLCELGPRPYAITDGEQRELSDRWDEALQIRQWVRDIWTELESE